MDVVLDANVLFRTLISHGAVVMLFFEDKLNIFAPERLKEEFYNNEEEILIKSTLSKEEFKDFASLLFEQISFIHIDEYKEFLPKAKKILGEHTKDEDFIALCLMKNIKLWTYEKLLFDIGFGITTKQIAEELYGL